MLPTPGLSIFRRIKQAGALSTTSAFSARHCPAAAVLGTSARRQNPPCSRHAEQQAGGLVAVAVPPRQDDQLVGALHRTQKPRP